MNKSERLIYLLAFSPGTDTAGLDSRSFILFQSIIHRLHNKYPWMPQPKIEVAEKEGNSIAWVMSGNTDKIYFNKKYVASLEKASSIKNNRSIYAVYSNIMDATAHEYGHLLSYELLKKISWNKLYRLMVVLFPDFPKTREEAVNYKLSTNKHNVSIYSGTSVGEFLAETFAASELNRTRNNPATLKIAKLLWKAFDDIGKKPSTPMTPYIAEMQKLVAENKAEKNRIKQNINNKWWPNLPEDAQRMYLKEHPKSKKKLIQHVEQPK
jgi:hypothetical protein